MLPYVSHFKHTLQHLIYMMLKRNLLCEISCGLITIWHVVARAGSRVWVTAYQKCNWMSNTIWQTIIQNTTVVGEEEVIIRKRQNWIVWQPDICWRFTITLRETTSTLVDIHVVNVITLHCDYNVCVSRSPWESSNISLKFIFFN